MSADMLLVNASGNTGRNASFINSFFSIYLISKKTNICKQYIWYNKSSENLYNNLNQRQLQENKRTTESPMFNEI